MHLGLGKEEFADENKLNIFHLSRGSVFVSRPRGNQGLDSHGRSQWSSWPSLKEILIGN